MVQRKDLRVQSLDKQGESTDKTDKYTKYTKPKEL